MKKLNFSIMVNLSDISWTNLIMALFYKCRRNQPQRIKEVPYQFDGKIVMKKKPTLYIIILLVWTASIAVLALSLAFAIRSIPASDPVRSGIIISLLSVNTVCIGLMWLGSVKDLVFSLAYIFLKKKFAGAYNAIAPFDAEENLPKVALLYCTCNDFNAKALSACRKQNYPNFYTVILDDSSRPEYIREINKYRATHGNVLVHRREDKSGFKAGNLNSYLKQSNDYDYFVVLDSDEIIPPDYITSALKYFANYENCGAVQAKHCALKGNNAFQSLLGMCVLSNGSTVQIVKNFYGANALMGHGMMISRACYEKTSGFPLVVAEDISFAVDIKNAGYEIVYAPDIMCYEEFPANYAALKKRQCKWTQGNLEYMRLYDKDIRRSKMTWYEKLDLKLSHYSLPVVPMLGFMLMLCTIALGFAGYPSITYSAIVYSVMIIFLCSPLIPDILVYAGKKTFLLLLVPYFIVNIATYASLTPMMLTTIIKGLFGKKATFIVTPKDGGKMTIGDVFRYSWDAVVFAAAIGILSAAACGSILPVIFVAAGCVSAPLVTLLANIPVKVSRSQNAYNSYIPVEKAPADGNALLAGQADVSANAPMSATALNGSAELLSSSAAIPAHISHGISGINAAGNATTTRGR